MSALENQFGGDAVRKSVAINETSSVVLGPLDVQNYQDIGIYVENVGGGSADPITSVTLQTAPAVDGPWVDWNAVLDGNCNNGETQFFSSANAALKYIRLSANCAAGKDTTANFWVCAGRYGR